MINIETNRLIIRDHIEEDIESLHNLLSDEKAIHYLPDIISLMLFLPCADCCIH
jgi:[ribosomal protein S5]-alanine N-acetyltransferase